VEGEEETEGQVLGEFRRVLVVKDKGEEIGECTEAFGVVGLVG
jgi:hypothetical protein